MWRRRWHPTPVLLPGKSHGWRSLVGCSPRGRKSRTQLSDFTFTFYFHALEKEMATHSSVLAWRIPGTGEPDGLPSMGLHRVRHDWSDLAAAGSVEGALRAVCLEARVKHCLFSLLCIYNPLYLKSKSAQLGAGQSKAKSTHITKVFLFPRTWAFQKIYL